MHHEIKIQDAYFQATIEGRKTFEIRDNNGRDFQAGDTVTMHEIYYLGNFPKHTGRWVKVMITHVTNYAQKDAYVVFAHKIMKVDDETLKQLIAKRAEEKAGRGDVRTVRAPDADALREAEAERIRPSDSARDNSDRSGEEPG